MLQSRHGASARPRMQQLSTLGKPTVWYWDHIHPVTSHHGQPALRRHLSVDVPVMYGGWLTSCSCSGRGRRQPVRKTHMQLCVLACLDVGLHRPTYDNSNSMCHSLLSRDILLPLTFTKLWLELCTPGQSCSYVALVALSAVLQLQVFSYFPPLQATFVSPMTLEIVGRDVDTCAQSVAVMWSTMCDVPAVGDVRINHIVSLHKRDETVPVPQPQSTATIPATVSYPGDNSGLLHYLVKVNATDFSLGLS